MLHQHWSGRYLVLFSRLSNITHWRHQYPLTKVSSLNLKFDILFYLLQVARLPFFKVADHRSEKYRWPRPNTSRMVAAYRQWCTREVSWIQTSNSLQWPEALPLISLRLVTSAGYLICPNDWEQSSAKITFQYHFFIYYLLIYYMLARNEFETMATIIMIVQWLCTSSNKLNHQLNIGLPESYFRRLVSDQSHWPFTRTLAWNDNCSSFKRTYPGRFESFRVDAWGRHRHCCRPPTRNYQQSRKSKESAYRRTGPIPEARWNHKSVYRSPVPAISHRINADMSR